MRLTSLTLSRTSCLHGGSIALRSNFSIGKKGRLASRVSHKDSSFLGGLYVGLVVTADTIPYRDKVEIFLVKDVPVFGRKLKQSIREVVIVLLLLYSVIQCRMSQIVFAISNEELFQLSRNITVE